MKSHVLIVAVLCGACGDAPTSPSTSPSSTLGLPAGPSVTMRGEVRDTANLPIAGAEVQAVAPGGTVSVTDGDGRFALPWPFSGTVTVRVSKEGFHARERQVPEPGSPRRPVFLRFDLEAIDTPVVVAGFYQMTLTAANECTQLPNAARQRTYRSRVYSTSQAGWFTAELFDGHFLYSRFVSAEVRWEPLQMLRVHLVTEVDWGNPVTSIVERIGPDMLLEFSGSADVPLGARNAAAALDGTFTVCPAEAAVSPQAPYRCSVEPVTCRSGNHRLEWMRR
jgi:hypothetical protein